MKPASIAMMKSELAGRSQKELTEICLHLARYKAENKELLSYLLFEAGDEAAYVREIKLEISRLFAEINTSHIYFIRKGVRKIVRNINKYIRFSGSKQTEAELLLFFCRSLKEAGFEWQQANSLVNLYKNQIQKIEKALSALHEDLQHDYREELKSL